MATWALIRIEIKGNFAVAEKNGDSASGHYPGLSNTPALPPRLRKAYPSQRERRRTEVGNGRSSVGFLLTELPLTVFPPIYTPLITTSLHTTTIKLFRTADKTPIVRGGTPFCIMT